MSFRVHVLASGSGGNSILLETSEVRVMVDAGLSGRRLEERLEAVGVEPDTVAALVITHEHQDHTRGMGVFARRWGTPIHLTRATAESCTKLLSGKERLHFYRPERPLGIGDLTVEPFLTCHDAVDPVAVTVRQPGSGLKLGVATDLGTPTVPVRHALKGCDLLVLEANHDDILLREGPYPWSVKSRIAGRHGHLSNRAAAELGRELAHRRLAGVVLAHLSAECNDPDLAARVVGGALRRTGSAPPVWVARQDEPLAVLDLVALHEAIVPPQLSLL
jgi:phosphoribosyl 1,2-cyclic phosphodiesterase